MTQGNCRRRLLRCEKCQKTIETTREELLKYKAGNWPRCCGEVMTFFVEFEPPEPGAGLPDEPPAKP